MRNVYRKNLKKPKLLPRTIAYDPKAVTAIANPVDAVVIMTPHNFFKDNYYPHMFNKECIIADVWKMWETSKKTKNGIYKVGDRS